MRARHLAATLSIVIPSVWALTATAQDPPDQISPVASASASPLAATPAVPTAAPHAEERKESLTPMPAHPPPDKMRFVADPLSDGAILGIAYGFVGLSSIIISSGELKPQQPVSTSKLSSLDKLAITQTIDPRAAMLSNVGLYTAIAFAVVDPFISGIRENSAQAMLVDAILYLESAGIAGGLTNLAKIAVRRPRPRAYIEQQRQIELGEKGEELSQTDFALSFPSGHASTVAAISGTATYLAFSRAKRTSPRPWLTLAIGVLMTAFTGYERVRAGAHFPTDVIGGALIGYGVGVLVPHIHREQTLKERPIWIGFQPQPGGGTASFTIGL